MLALVFVASTAALAPVPRIVFTDCDGTMLRPDHTLSPAAAAMLCTLRDKGIRVVPATGRARAGPWTDNVLNAYSVLQNGNPGVYING
jgi:hydroxymethylpyrimidine pyrophosphatase-like HAD family hydrolase